MGRFNCGGRGFCLLLRDAALAFFSEIIELPPDEEKGDDD